MTKEVITLVTEIKIDENGEQILETKDYVLPMFIKGGTVKQALKLAKDFNGLSKVLTDEKGNPIKDADGNIIVEEEAPSPAMIDRLAQFASDAFLNQFTKDEVIDGIDSRDLIETLTNVIGMVMSRGENEIKKKEFLEAKNR